MLKKIESCKLLWADTFNSRSGLSLQWVQFDVQYADRNAGRWMYWIIFLSRTLPRYRAAPWRKPARLVILFPYPEPLTLQQFVFVDSQVMISSVLCLFYIFPLHRCVWVATTTQRQQVTAWSVWSSCVWHALRRTRGSSSPGITPYARRKRCLQVVCCTWKENSIFCNLINLKVTTWTLFAVL